MKIEDYIDRVYDTPIFNDCDRLQVYNVVERFSHRFRKKKKGAHIIDQGDRLEDVILLLNGTVYTEMTHVSYKNLTVEQFRAPCILAPGFIYAHANYIYVNIIAKTDCEVLFISHQAFKELLHNNEHAMDNFLILLSDRVSKLCGKVQEFALQSLKERTLNYLKKGPIKNVDFVSSELGVERSSLSRVLSELRKENLIFRTMDGIELKT